MSAAPLSAGTPPPDPLRVDHRVLLRGVPWEQYEALVATRGENGGVRMTYLRGELEIMSPSREHETIKTLWGRLLEVFAEEHGVSLAGHGSWTLRSHPEERGLEPDECYVIPARAATTPDLALEVVWTSGLLDKLEVYRGLGVREVWVWREGRIEVEILRGDRYERAAGSELLPALDLALLASFLQEPDHTRAARAYREALRGK